MSVVSFAAVIRVVTRHATLNGCEGDYNVCEAAPTSLFCKGPQQT